MTSMSIFILEYSLFYSVTKSILLTS